jgi:hypothetical protein
MAAALITGSRGEAWRAFAGWGLAALLILIVVFGYLMPLTSYLSAVPGDLGDARYNSVILEHLYRVATGYREGLWNPAFYFPFQGALAFSDNHLGSGATYVLARVLGLPREQAFNAWFAAGTLLNFASALYVLRRLGIGSVGAALGAFFFTLALPVPAQDVHAQLVHRFPSPLAMLATWQMLERRRLADLPRAAFFTVWQFYCSIYLGLFLVYLLAALVFAVALTRSRNDWQQWRANLAGESRRTKLWGGGILLGSVLALAYIVGNYYFIAQHYNLRRPVEAVAEMLPRLGSYLLADNSPLLAWLGRDVAVPARWEHQLFIGFGAMLLIAASIVWRRRTALPQLASACLIAVAVLVAGTLWVGGFSFYHLVVWLPGVESMRAVTRIILIMLLPLSVLLALGADAIWRRCAHGLPSAAAALVGLTALTVIEPLTVRLESTPIAQWDARMAAVRSRLPQPIASDAILMVRSSSPQTAHQIHAELDGMLLGQDLGRPVLNGYGGFSAPGYRLLPCASPKERLWGYFLHTGGRVKVAYYWPRLVVVDLDKDCPLPSP